MNALNQISYPLIALAGVIVIFTLMRLLLKLPWRPVLIVEGMLGVVFLIGFLVLHPGSGDITDLQTARALIGNGRPTFVEFFSNYCTSCLLLRPTVDGIVAGIDDDFNILRINIHSAEGRELRQQYDFSFTPEFVLYDGQGHEIWRDHQPPSTTQLDDARDYQDIN